MSNVLSTQAVLTTEAVLSTEAMTVGVDLGDHALWPPLTAATQVLRWAVMLARVSGVPLVAGSTGDVQGSVGAQVVSAGSWVSVAVAGGLFCIQVIRRVRSGERGVGYAVAVYVAAVAGTTAVAVIAVRAADALTEVALARGPGAAELAVLVGQRAAGAADPGAVGSTAGPVALLLVWASGWIYLVEMACRLAVLLALTAVVPLVGAVRASASAPWRARALGWAIVALVSKPVLTVVLMTGVSALVRSEVGSLRGSVGLVGGVAGLVLLVCGPITLFQFTHRLVSASAARGTCSSPGLLTRLIRGPVRHGEAVDQRELPDTERRTSIDGPPTPIRRRRGARSPMMADRVVVEVLAALRRWSTRPRRGRAAGTGATAGGVAWPVVRELIVPSVPAVTPAVTRTRAARQRRGPVNQAAELPAQPLAESDTTPPFTAGASLSATTTSRPQGSGDTLAADRADLGGSSAGPCVGDDGPSRCVTAEAPAGSGPAARSTGSGEVPGVGGAAGAESESVVRPPWALAILGRPTLLAVGSDGGDTATACTGRRGVGGGRDAVPGGVVAVEVTARLTPKMLELLVYLAVHPHGVRRDTVVAALWPDTARPRPANNLSALITRLRAALPRDGSSPATGPTGSRSSATAATEVGGLVTTDGDRYLVDPDHVRVDYWSFLAATEQAIAGDAGDVGRQPHLSDAAVAALHAAHEVYGGPLADGLDGEWVLSVREAARRSFLDVTARLVRHHIRDSPTVALRLLEKARNLDPTNEKLYRDIIALQLRTGDDAGAEQTLRLLETQLADIDETVSESLAALAHNIHRPHA